MDSIPIVGSILMSIFRPHQEAQKGFIRLRHRHGRKFHYVILLVPNLYLTLVKEIKGTSVSSMLVLCPFINSKGTHSVLTYCRLTKANANSAHMGALTDNTYMKRRREFHS